jgi:RNA polymerase-associated protein
MSERKDIRTVLSKRSVMTLFSDPAEHYSHRVRILLAEKAIVAQIFDIDARDYPAELAELNPYCSLPVLVDRDLVLYESRALMEYLDERYPHPPLLPLYPVARAQSRQLLQRIERDWSRRVDAIVHPKGGEVAAGAARRELLEELVSVSPVFGERPFFMGDEFSLLDCCLGALLWRLPALGIDIPLVRQTKPLHDYMARVFARESFQESLSLLEKEMRRR